mmetsp:Transcript_4069/g.5019  ORF Transcript_4069/g.5019 Transcript_4069/m.5019 type:complete len:148 (+) Transcript_4069:98-541(+)|eukprot:jgi/Bigna1/86368/estExt_fgenesh1_pg.C_100050
MIMQESKEVKSEVKLDVVSTQPARDSVGGKGAEEKDVEDPLQEEPWYCYRSESGVLMFSGLTCGEWGWITLAFLIGYALLTAILAGFLAAEFIHGLATLWAFFGIFVVFVIIVAGIVLLGEFHRWQDRSAEVEESKKKAMGEIIKHH